MWIKSTEGSLVNLSQCNAMHVKEFRGGFQVYFDTAGGQAIQVKSGTKAECQEYFDSIAIQLTTADPNSTAIVDAINHAGDVMAAR